MYITRQKDWKHSLEERVKKQTAPASVLDSCHIETTESKCIVLLQVCDILLKQS